MITSCGLHMSSEIRTHVLEIVARLFVIQADSACHFARYEEAQRFNQSQPQECEIHDKLALGVGARVLIIHAHHNFKSDIEHR